MSQGQWASCCLPEVQCALGTLSIGRREPGSSSESSGWGRHQIQCNHLAATHLFTTNFIMRMKDETTPKFTELEREPLVFQEQSRFENWPNSCLKTTTNIYRDIGICKLYKPKNMCLQTSKWRPEAIRDWSKILDEGEEEGDLNIIPLSWIHHIIIREICN